MRLIVVEKLTLIKISALTATKKSPIFLSIYMCIVFVRQRQRQRQRHPPANRHALRPPPLLLYLASHPVVAGNPPTYMERCKRKYKGHYVLQSFAHCKSQFNFPTCLVQGGKPPLPPASSCSEERPTPLGPNDEPTSSSSGTEHPPKPAH